MQQVPIWLLLVAVPLALALFAGLTVLVTACAISATFRARCGRRLRALAPLALVALVLFVALGSWRTTVEQEDAFVPQSLTHQREESDRERTQAAVRRQELTLQTAPRRPVEEGSLPGGTPATSSPPEPPSAEPPPTRITLFEGRTQAGVEVRDLPPWVQEPEQVDQDRDIERFVLRSSRYADVEEAEAELLARLAPRAAEYLSRGGVELSPEQITLEEIRRGAVLTRRLHEQFEVRVGAFTQPVYRVTWEVSLRPSVRESLGAAQRLAERNRRLWELGGGFGLATLLLGTLAAYFFIDDATQGRYRRRLRVAAGTIAAAAAAVTLRLIA